MHLKRDLKELRRQTEESLDTYLFQFMFRRINSPPATAANARDMGKIIFRALLKEIRRQYPV